MIPAPFTYVRPGSIDEALEALAHPDARAIAGGHSLVPLMKLRLARPAVLVDLAPLDLRGIRVDGSLLRVGALTTYTELLACGPEVPVPRVVRDCCAATGDAQVRNAGTLGGGLAHADPASDLAAGIIAAGGTLRLRSPDGTREVAAEDFFVGPFATVIQQQELLEEIVLPVPQPGEGSAYVSFDDPASGFALAGAAARVAADGACVVAITGFGPSPRRVPAVERAIAEGSSVLDALQEIDGDEYGGGVDYRRQLVAVAIDRAVASAQVRREGA